MRIVVLLLVCVSFSTPSLAGPAVKAARKSVPKPVTRSPKPHVKSASAGFLRKGKGKKALLLKHLSRKRPVQNAKPRHLQNARQQKKQSDSSPSILSIVSELGANVNITGKQPQNGQLELGRDDILIIGRQEGRPKYLHPEMKSTQRAPDGQEAVNPTQPNPEDAKLSRAHFSLRRGPGGSIVIINGVPSSNGTIRPPKNGTRIQTVSKGRTRKMQPAERFQVEAGNTVRLLLPNGAIIRIGAMGGETAYPKNGG